MLLLIMGFQILIHSTSIASGADSQSRLATTCRRGHDYFSAMSMAHDSLRLIYGNALQGEVTFSVPYEYGNNESVTACATANLWRDLYLGNPALSDSICGSGSSAREAMASLETTMQDIARFHTIEKQSEISFEGRNKDEESYCLACRRVTFRSKELPQNIRKPQG